MGDTLTKPAFTPIQSWLLKHLQINIQTTGPEEQHCCFARRRTLQKETTKTRKSKAEVEDNKDEAEASQRMPACQLTVSYQSFLMFAYHRIQAWRTPHCRPHNSGPHRGISTHVPHLHSVITLKSSRTWITAHSAHSKQPIEHGVQLQRRVLYTSRQWGLTMLLPS